MARKRKRRSVCFSDEEWALILERAQQSGISDRSVFIRAMALYAVPNQKIKQILGASK
jgi:hypothetical protein